MPLTDDDYKTAAKELGCDIASIRAVASVESAGEGFLEDGRVRVLFEAHIFSRYTKGRFDDSHPNLSSSKWNRKLYRGGAAEWDRLAEAVELDRKAALMSASWGAFQLMGFNFAACAFTTVDDFVSAMKTEQGQLEAFVEFIKSQGLADELQRRDWAGFARIYNGPAFKANSYDARMAKAYDKFSAEEKAKASTALSTKENSA
jgi:hypothetical protein